LQRLVAVELSAAAGAAAAGAAASSVLLFLLPLLLYRRCCRLTAPTDMGLLLRAPSLQRVVWCTPVSCACHHLPGAREQLERHAHKHEGRHCGAQQHWERGEGGEREGRARGEGRGRTREDDDVCLVRAGKGREGKGGAAENEEQEEELRVVELSLQCKVRPGLSF